MKKTAKIVLMSVLTIAMCVSLIAGATFALFTSDDSVNIAVSSGKVEISASLGDYSLYTNLYGKVTEMKDEAEIHPVDEWTNGGKVAMSGDTITLDRMTPGDGVKFDINVNNESNVAIQYRVSLSVVKDDGLLSGLEVTINNEKLGASDMYIASSWTPVAAKSAIDPISVQVELPESAGNEYKDLTCDLLVTVEAVQGNAKPNELIKVDDKHYIANSAASLIAFADALANGAISSSEGNGAAHLAITKDIDLAGYNWMPMAGAHIVIDGGNHTISNVNCGTSASGKSAFVEGYGVTINDLTIDGLTAKGTQAAAFIGNSQGGSMLNNCTLKGNVSITYDKAANESETHSGIGVLTGVHFANDKASNVTIAEGCNITLDVTRLETACVEATANLMFGYAVGTADIPAEDLYAQVTNNGTITIVGTDIYIDSTATVEEAIEIIRNAENGAVIDGQGMTLSSGGDTLRIDNGKDVTLKNFTLKTTSGSSYAIALSPGASVTLEDCKVEGKAWFSGENITIRNTSFNTNINVEGVKDVLIEGCTFTKADAITLAGTLENVTIEGNTFTGSALFSGPNIRIYAGATITNVKVINNTATSRYGLSMNVDSGARTAYNEAVANGNFVFANNN